jgi:hypothetical protein
MQSSLVALGRVRPGCKLSCVRSYHAGRTILHPSRDMRNILSRRYRPLSVAVQRALSTAQASTPGKTNEDQQKRKTFQIYLDNVYPIRRSFYDPRFIFYTRRMTNTAAKRLRDYLNEAAKKAAADAVAADPDPPMTSKTLGLPFQATLGDIIPRVKDGGILITIHYTPPDAKASASTEADDELARNEVAMREILMSIQDALQDSRRAWFNLRRPRAFLVHGKPFVEDLASHYPSKRLRVELYNDDTNLAPRAERIYYLFREFGRIKSIEMPPPSNYFPRSVIVRFHDLRSAAAAKNCLHGYRTKLRQSSPAPAHLSIQYEPNVKFIKAMVDWLTAHPRITLPLILALLAAITYTVFDPIRMFFIRCQAEGTFDLGRYANDLHRLGQRFKRRMGRSLSSDRYTDHMQWGEDASDILEENHAWQGRHNDEQLLKRWLEEPPDTFIIVDGPPGSGKTSLVNQVLQDHDIYLCIDCNAVLTGRDKQEVVERLASQIGYMPQFRLMAKISAIIDSMVNATTGADPGLSSDTRERIKTILGTCGEALEAYGEEGILDKLLGEKGPTRRHIYPAMKEDGPPERRDYPIIVLDGFFDLESEHDDEVWHDFATWASMLVERVSICVVELMKPLILLI